MGLIGLSAALCCRAFAVVGLGDRLAIQMILLLCAILKCEIALRLFVWLDLVGGVGFIHFTRECLSPGLRAVELVHFLPRFFSSLHASF